VRDKLIQLYKDEREKAINFLLIRKMARDVDEADSIITDVFLYLLDREDLTDKNLKSLFYTALVNRFKTLYTREVKIRKRLNYSNKSEIDLSCLEEQESIDSFPMTGEQVIDLLKSERRREILTLKINSFETSEIVAKENSINPSTFRSTYFEGVREIQNKLNLKKTKYNGLRN